MSNKSKGKNYKEIYGNNSQSLKKNLKIKIKQVWQNRTEEEKKKIADKIINTLKKGYASGRIKSFALKGTPFLRIPMGGGYYG